MKLIKIMSPVAVSIAAILATGCATTGESVDGMQAELDKRQAALDAREKTLNSKANALTTKEVNLNKQAARTVVAAPVVMKQDVAAEKYQLTSADLLPPNAVKGECYARVWQGPTYKTNQESLMVKESYEKIEITPAKYKMASTRVEVSGASSKLVTKPAIYGTEKTRVLVKEAGTNWHVNRSRKSALVSSDVLSFAKAHSIDDISAATPGMCFHEHRKPAKYTKDFEKVMVSEAYDVVSTVPAQYEMVSETIVVKEASTKIVVVPAKYRTESKRILITPAKTVWKKGSGPIQRIDSATGEIMCLVEVPAVYKTIKTRVIDTPATTRTVNVPEVTKTVKIRQEVAAAKEVRKTIPAKYKTITNKTKIEGDLTWHEIHNKSMSAESRTGRQICLVESPAVYKTTTKRVVKVPASTRKVNIPAKYKTIKVRTLVSAASERRTTVPAVYKTVTSQELVKEGQMEWRSILCETNMTRSRVTDIQRALKAKGFNPGPIDGVIGKQTIKAMNKFQKANKLPVDRYLNVQSIRALGVSER